MKNRVQDGRIVPILTTDAIIAGGLVNQGSLTGVAVVAASSGAHVECFLEGVFEGLPLTGTSPSAGDILYYDKTAKALTKTASGNSKAGHFLGGGLVRLSN